MKSRYYIQFLILGLIALVLSNCTKEDPDLFGDSNYVIVDKLSQNPDRLNYRHDRVPFKKLKSSQSTNNDQYSFTLEYILEGPVVDGARVQASHIVYRSEKVYLSYNTNGELVRGGMEVIDFDDPTDPKLMTTGIRNAEFSSLDIYTKPSTGKSYLMLAGSGYNASGIVSSQLRLFQLNSLGYPLLNPEIIDLEGYTATDVNALGVVTGSYGGFYTVDELTLNFANLENELEDARSVAYNPTDGQYCVLLGNPGRLVTGLPDNPKTIQLGGISYEGTKAIVRIRNGFAYAALGDGGLKVVDLASGLITASIDRPEVPEGQNPKNYVTNAVSVNETGLIFIANGAAGVYVAKITDLGQLELLGFLDLNASVNYVEAHGDYLFAAIGGDGVAIIKMEGVQGPLPQVTTHFPDEDKITQSTAVVGGDANKNGGNEILNKGICWGTVDKPTIYDNRTNMGPNEGSFLSNLDGLVPNTRYFIRAYAATAQGTYYGESLSFYTHENGNDSGKFTDQRDGKTYRTVQIGNQVWMAENLSWLPEVSPVASGSMIEPFYYVYNYNGFNIDQAKSLSSYKTYGVLYNWDAAKQSCPDGWHLPTDEEWAVMEMFLGMEGNEVASERFRNTGFVGEKLKAGAGWFNEQNGNNSSDFTAIPAGYRGRGGEYKYEGSNANFWTATDDEYMAVCRGLYYFNNGVFRSSWYKSAGFSVRCIKD